MWSIDLVEKRSITKYKNFLSYVTLGKENLAFGYIEVEKDNLDRYKSLFLEVIDTDNILVSNKKIIFVKKLWILYRLLVW